jgi:hypothetical protein
MESIFSIKQVLILNIIDTRWSGAIRLGYLNL